MDTYDYDTRDYEIVDYQSYELPGAAGVRLRGPSPDLEARDWFTCIGAAQTMGIYITNPFPNLVSELLGTPVLNLGVGAGWPAMFVDNHPRLLDWANDGKFVVLQAMSARGGSSSRYEPTGKVEQLKDRDTGEVLNSVKAWYKVLRDGPAAAEEYLSELRTSWVKTNLELINRLDVPVLFFWYSRRSPDEPVGLSIEGNLFENMGEFPQFVDRASLDAVAAACAGQCECTSTRNTGHALISRFTGEPVTVDHGALDADRPSKARTAKPRPTATEPNGVKSGETKAGLSLALNEYYPSPEMHADAAEVVAAAVQRLGL